MSSTQRIRKREDVGDCMTGNCLLELIARITREAHECQERKTWREAGFPHQRPETLSGSMERCPDPVKGRIRA